MEDRNQNLGYLLNKTVRLMKWKFNHALKEYGLTIAQWSVIKDVSVLEETAPDELQLFSPALIAERLYLDRPTISGILDRAIKNGWLRRENNPHDRRSQVIRLTEKSRKAVGKLNKLSNEITGTAVEGFTAGEIDQLKNILVRMTANLLGEDI